MKKCNTQLYLNYYLAALHVARGGEVPVMNVVLVSSEVSNVLHKCVTSGDHSVQTREILSGRDGTNVKRAGLGRMGQVMNVD